MKSPNALPVWQNVHHPRQRSRCRVLIAILSALTPRGSRLASTSLSPAYAPGVEWIQPAWFFIKHAVRFISAT